MVKLSSSALLDRTVDGVNTKRRPSLFCSVAIASTLALSTLMGASKTPALAEGTAQVGATQRLYEYGATSPVLSVTNRPLNVDIVSAGEVINISVCARELTNNIRIEIYDPTGTQVLTTTLNDGTFGNANCQHTFSAGTPLPNPVQYQATQAGTYEIRLFNLRTTAGNNTADDTVFRLFDVTVAPNAGTAVTGTETGGRLHTTSWAFRAITNNFSEAGSADSDYFVKVPGGRAGENFVWLLDLNNFAGLTYEIVANNIGVDPPNSSFSTEFSGNSITPLYPIYLSYPTVLDPLPQTPPEFSNFSFIDSDRVDNTISPANNDGTQDAGTFEFTTDVEGTYSIVIDADDNGVFEPGADVYLFGTTVNGLNSVVWDGRDNNNDPLPVGTYSVSAEVRVGEYHFVAGDAETSGGPSVPGLTIFQALSQLNMVDTLVYWDDVTLLPASAGGTTTLPTGQPSSSSAARHTWGTFSGTGFGNQRYIDTYVYGDRTLGDTPVIIADNDDPVSSDPNVLLTKRITAINRGLVDEQLFDSSLIDVDSNSDADNAVNWPGPAAAENFGGGTSTVESYITGIAGVNGGIPDPKTATPVDNVQVKPGDVLEYTISFLSDGDGPAQDLLVCDHIPPNTTFDPSAFNSSPPAPAGAGDRGIFVSFGNQAVALTNTNDGDEIVDSAIDQDDGVGGYYFTAGVEPSVELGVSVDCNGTNDNGVIVVDLSDVPNATGDGAPLNAFGFIRFRTVVD